MCTDVWNHGLDDLDGAAIRDGRPRALTQAISQWINTLTDPNDQPVTGVEFDSRHGDGLRLWAIYERPGDPLSSPTSPRSSLPPSRRTIPNCGGRCDLLGLEWTDT